MPDVFKLDGKYEFSSKVPTITVDGKEVSRQAFWDEQIKKTVDALPAMREGEEPIYVATGGGYGSYGALTGYEKKHGKLPAAVIALRGALFRDLPEFEEEKKRVREQVRQQIGEEALQRNPDAVEQVVSSFYSDEVNTKIAKEGVKATFPERKSSIYESASIYPDTIERAVAAKKNGIKTVLIAGDKDLAQAIEEKKAEVEPANVAKSYQKFAARFESELMPLFDEIRLYNVDGKEPKLIAEKTDKNAPLVILDEALYKNFLAKATIDVNAYKSSTADFNQIWQEHKEMEAKKTPDKGLASTLQQILQAGPQSPKEQNSNEPGTGPTR